MSTTMAPTPLLRLPHVRPVVRDTLGAAAVVAGPALIAAGSILGGLTASAIGTVLLASRRLRAAPGWNATGAGWVPVTTEEVERLATLLQSRARWARDPWHVAGGAGFWVWLACAAAAAAAIGGVLLGIEAGLAGRLSVAALAALLPPFCLGGRAAATPAQLESDLRVTQDTLAANRARPEPGWQPVPELLLADAGAGRSVPAGARVRLSLSADPPAVTRAWIERGDDGAGRAVFRLRPSPAIRATLAGLGEGYASSAGTDYLQVVVAPGPDLLARVSDLSDRLQSAVA